LLDDLAMDHDRTERLAVPVDRSLEVTHSDGDVVDLGEQAAGRGTLHIGP
jgi:hypothetical protein